MSNEMMIDMDSFDFSMLGDEDATPVNAPVVEEEDFEDNSDLNFDFDSEDGVDDGEDEEGEELDEDGINSLQDFASSFDDIPDTLEFNIGGEVVAKADIVQAAKQRKEIASDHEELKTYIQNLNDIEQRQEGYMNLAISETESRLNSIYAKLQNPASMTQAQLTQALTSKAQLEEHYKVLETNVLNSRAEAQTRRDHVNQIKVRQTDLAMRGTAGYKGVETLRGLANFAQESGLDPQNILDSISPAFVSMLMDAKRFRDATASKRSKLEAITSKKVSSTSPRSTSSRPKAKTVRATNANKAAIMKKAAQGTLSSEDFFNNLED